MISLSQLCSSISPYTAGEQPQDKQYIKLNTNENPYPPSPMVDKAIKNFNTEKLKLYPDPNQTELRQAIAENLSVNKDNVFVGNGSDEVLSFAFAAFFNPGDIVTFADITYSFYPVYAEYYRLKIDKIALKDFAIDKKEYFKRKSKGIIICNPNAPTSLSLTADDIIEIVEKNKDKIVIIDEAYIDFCNETVVAFIKKYDNLLVIRTFSKSYSLAGIRCGFAIGNASLIEGLNQIKNSVNSYTINQMTSKISTIAIADKKYFNLCCNKVITTRDNVIKDLRNIGVTVLDSSTNFVFVLHNNAEEIYIALKQRGILVRYFKNLPHSLRITIGTDEEMSKLTEALKCLI